MSDDYLKTADVWTVLDLIAAEFTSDPTSVACFDLRVVRRAIELNDAHRAAGAATLDDLRTALEESVKLQSHYAELLNMHDGGRRIGFANADAWIRRLRETGTL